MTEHSHSTFVPGCYRCDLGRDEAEFARQEESRDIALLRGRLANWDGTTTSFDALLENYGITREQLDEISDEPSLPGVLDWLPELLGYETSEKGGTDSE